MHTAARTTLGRLGVPSLLAVACALGAISQVALASPAAAQPEDYLHSLAPRYVDMSPQQLLSAGYRACSIIDSGNAGSIAVDSLARELGLGVADADQVVRAAVVHLGC